MNDRRTLAIRGVDETMFKNIADWEFSTGLQLKHDGSTLLGMACHHFQHVIGDPGTGRRWIKHCVRDGRGTVWIYGANKGIVSEFKAIARGNGVKFADALLMFVDWVTLSNQAAEEIRNVRDESTGGWLICD